ncbi:MAG TPA: 23S rRNA (pseudouridine(1915)-N(3))-methyltransferase RlmH [Patescibacteria group bacterium]|jgi:23S rRNA (pseudouridine1915-N3)-methyltransferase|nr:23S rRNA (pseudouridine(1915)-N(3))-methyltransferase RlmH [Patescibacteria group bacterium]
MRRIDIIAAGKMRAGPLSDLWDEYRKRVKWPVTLIEVEGRNAAEEQRKLGEKIESSAFLFALDEKGKSLRSADFASKLEKLAVEGQSHIQFVIGGADGLDESLRKKARFLLSFGSQTWPHMLVRVMLMEQLYRARQIIDGHPYHRE